MKKTYDHALSIEELVALPDDQIDTSDIPELGEAFWSDAKVVVPQSKESDRKDRLSELKNFKGKLGLDIDLGTIRGRK